MGNQLFTKESRSTEEYIPSFHPLRLVHPEPPPNETEVKVRRGDLITLSIHFLGEPGLYVLVDSSGIPSQGDETGDKKMAGNNINGLSLEMELWDMTRPHRFPFKEFCVLDHDQSLISETGSCGCLVRFHGRYFAIRDQRAEICFEFPVIGNGHKKPQKYEYVIDFLVGSCTEIWNSAMRRIIVLLRQLGLSPNIIGRYPLSYNFTVDSSTEQPHTEATPLIPAHVQRLLSPHTLSETVFMLHGSFGHILAEVLGLNCHCIPLHSALSSDVYLEMIYHLSTANRKLLVDRFRGEIRHCRTLVKGDSKEMESLEQQYAIANLTATLRAPICYFPDELLDEIFRISVELLSVTPSTLQRVCLTWRAVVARLWGTLQVGTWTDTKRVAAVLDKNPLSLDVVIDTAADESHSTIAEKPYAALTLAWPSASKWNSLTITSFPNSAAMRDRNITFDPCVPVDDMQLETLSIGPGCDSSDLVSEVMKAIASTENPKLTTLILSATTVFRQLNQSDWVCNCSQLTVLELNVVKVVEPVDLLRPFARLERLKLSGVVLDDLLPGEELLFLQTLRHLWLQRVSIRWMSGRAFGRLESCTLLTPVDPRSIDQTRMIGLPVCTSITLHSKVASVLAAFDARAANKIEIACNEWNDARASYELGRIWSRRGILRPKVLSLNIRCSNKALLAALQQMSSLEDLTLVLPLPTTLGASFFKALRGTPVKPFTGRTKEEWTRWANEAEFRVGICPSLMKLELRYERWLRGGDMDVASPLLIAVAWSRGKLRPPLQKFDLKLEGSKALQLMGMTYQDSTFMSLWQHTQGIPQSNTQQDMLHTSSLTATINQSIGFVNGECALPFDWLGSQYYDSFFRHLRVFHHHPSELPTRPYDILPSFKHLEELVISNFHFTPCPRTASLALCQTLRKLHIRDTPLEWMDERKFERVEDCKIAVCIDEHISRLSRVEMPACTRMEFAGRKGLKVLEHFYPPNYDSRLELSGKEKPHARTAAVQDIVLIAPATPPIMPRIRAKLKEKKVEVVSEGTTAIEPKGKVPDTRGKVPDKRAKGRFLWLRKLFGVGNVRKQK